MWHSCVYFAGGARLDESVLWLHYVSLFFSYFGALLVDVAFFFFSSRRRHTRLVSDWSSDVCSSDLCRAARFPFRRAIRPTARPRRRSRCSSSHCGTAAGSTEALQRRVARTLFLSRGLFGALWSRARAMTKIGRASCRERV